MLDVIEFIENYNYLFAIIYSILGWMFCFLSTRYTKQIRKKRLNRILSFKKEEVEIVVPIRHGKLTLSSPFGATELTDTYVTESEMQSALKAKEMFDELGLKVSIRNQRSRDRNNNVFCIGGPLSNMCTANYFRDRQILNFMTFGIPRGSEYLSELNRSILCDFVHEDVGEKRSLKLNGETIIDFNAEYEGYIFLAKLSGDVDFGDGEHGTVHICFGNTSKTTYGAITSYSKHRKKLSTLLKNKKNYCLLFRCDTDGNINFNNHIDIADKVLVHNSSRKESV